MNDHALPHDEQSGTFRDLILLGAGILIFVYVSSYYVFSQFSGLSRIPFATACVLTLLLVARGFQLGRLQLPSLWFLPWVFVLYSALSLLWVRDMDHGLSRMAQILSAVMGGTSIWIWMCNGITWRPVAYGAIAGSVILGGSMVPEILSRGFNARSAGIALNSNATGILLSYVAFFTWCAPVKIPRWTRWLGVAFLLYAAAFTGSRKVLLCLLAFLALYGLQIPSVRKRVALGLTVLVIMGSIFAFAQDKARIIETVTSLQVVRRTEAALAGQDHSYLKRIGMYHEAFEMWKERPVRGWGVGQFAELSDFATYTHSNYMQLLANLGVIGFALIYLFHLSLLVRAYQAYKAGTREGKSALMILLMIFALDTSMVSIIGKGSWLLLIFIERLCTESERGLYAMQNPPPDPAVHIASLNAHAHIPASDPAEAGTTNVATPGRIGS